MGQIHAASQARYGSPRIQAELRAAGMGCSRMRVARLMWAIQLKGKTRRRFRVVPTDARHADSIAPNHLARQIGGPDRVWAADYTVLPTRHGFSTWPWRWISTRGG